TPSLLDIVQHGWAHTDHSLAGERKYEFGPSRSQSHQRHDLRRGRAAMTKAFGSLFTPLLVPPYHGYDARTLALVKQGGFVGFSAGKKVFPAGCGVLDLPASISFSPRNILGRKVDCRYMLRRLAREIVPGRLTGILFHHEQFAAAGLERELALFFRGLSRWRDKGNVKIVLLSDVINRSAVKAECYCCSRTP
ncbi:MAG: hypothetical protein HQL22_08195, partial [Candidatus Omnitrophica bacterium]|nr:hypothetical protein [Candidatus Omnitrophota bacterium]